MTSIDPLIEPDKEKYLRIKEQRRLLQVRLTTIELELASVKLELMNFMNIIANRGHEYNSM